MDKKTELDSPTDNRRFVYISFYYIGLTILFPFIMLITIMDFWNYKFRDTSISHNSTNQQQLTDLQKKFPGYLSISGNLPLSISVIFTVIFGWRFSLKKRLILTALGEIVAFGVIVVAASLDTDKWQESLLVLVLVAVTVYTIVNGVFQASFLGNIGRFPPRYIGIVYQGTGLGQVLAVIVGIIVLAMSLPEQIVGIACLSFVLIAIVIMMIFYVFLSKSLFYRHHSGLDEKNPIGPSLSDFLTVFKSIWLYFLVVFFDYAITFSVHPALTALIKPVSTDPNPWNEKYFVPVCCFLVQAVSDWVGRFIATTTQWPKPGKWTDVAVAVAVLARIAFIPLMMRCNIAPYNRTTEVWFSSDVAWVTFLVPFGLTGGYLANVGLMLGPKKIGLELQETAGMILTTALVTGLGIGSTFGPSIVSYL